MGFFRNIKTFVLFDLKKNIKWTIYSLLIHLALISLWIAIIIPLFKSYTAKTRGEEDKKHIVRNCTTSDYKDWIKTLNDRENLNNVEYSNNSNIRSPPTYINIYATPWKNEKASILWMNITYIDSPKNDYCKQVAVDEWDCFFPPGLNMEDVQIEARSSSGTAFLTASFGRSKESFGELSPELQKESTLSISPGATFVALYQQSKVYIPSTELFSEFLDAIGAAGASKCFANNETLWQPWFEVKIDFKNKTRFQMNFISYDVIYLVTVRAAITLDVTIGLAAAYLGFADILIRIILHFSKFCKELYTGRQNKNDYDDNNQPLLIVFDK